MRPVNLGCCGYPDHDFTQTESRPMTSADNRRPLVPKMNVVEPKWFVKKPTPRIMAIPVDPGLGRRALS